MRRGAFLLDMDYSILGVIYSVLWLPLLWLEYLVYLYICASRHDLVYYARIGDQGRFHLHGFDKIPFNDLGHTLG